MTTQDQNDILHEHVYASEVETFVLQKISKEKQSRLLEVGHMHSTNLQTRKHSRILACKINKIRSNLVLFCSYYPRSHEK
jgi:hypothetical protein